ncbi:hypothetical protein JGU71_06815 [Antrihabitans sp. YC3-6]|uniref:Tox-REase-5 domain-containing protein n=1 Tax=Antrihabitans stalagmiti TaxID=2799499 RepID=A0A934NNV6_9NOCA|nr:hypothetical protein [Antrihabitans stalagmiti]
MAILLVLLGVWVTANPSSTKGTAYPIPELVAQAELNEATFALAQAEGAQYSGTFTPTEDLPPIDFEDLTVSNSGTMHGTIVLEGIPAEIVTINGDTLVKASNDFWFSILTTDYTGEFTDKWTRLQDDFFGVDLSNVLAPSNLAWSIQGLQDRTAGDVVAGPDALPNARQPLTSSTAASESTPEGTEVSVGPFATYVGGAGSIPNRVKGPVNSPNAKGGNIDAEIDPVDAAEVERLYQFIEQVTRDLVNAADAAMSFSMDSNTSLGNCNNTSCSILTVVTNTLTGADRSTINVHVRTDFNVDGVPTKSCDENTTMPANGQVSVFCNASYFADPEQRHNLEAWAKVTAHAYAETDIQAIINIVDGQKKRDTSPDELRGPGTWRQQPAKNGPDNRRYHEQNTGRPSDFGYVVNGVPFDGRAADGTLLQVQGAGFGSHIGPDGALDPNWPGTQQLVKRGRDQVQAAGSAPIRWVFAEEAAAAAGERALREAGLTQIVVTFVPGR